jgi:glutamine---fructose-6-phosphate transaminase (isomerizing)
MCGIISYFGNSKDTKSVLLNGLKKLEYRGYDSAGVSFFNDLDQIDNVKSTGKVINLEQKLTCNDYKFGKIGIAHTRWATHGVPSEGNAHPHVSQDGKIHIVHNGIIENYKVLKTQLEQSGFNFTSQTDSEVIAQSIEFHYQGSLLEAVQKTITQLEGAFSIVVMHQDHPNQLIGVRNGSPMVIGIKGSNAKEAETEFFIASDVSAFGHLTKSVIFMEQGLINILDGNMTIYDKDNNTIKPEVITLDWNPEQSEKEGYEHFLLKEIHEQPKAILDTIRGRVDTEKTKVLLDFKPQTLTKIKQIDKVVLLGVGTSFYACKLGEMYFQTIAKLPAVAYMTPEFRYQEPYVDSKTWVIAISQSGETADTIAAIEEASKHGALVTSIVNVVSSTVARITDDVVYNQIGPEISVASSKAFSSQAVLLLLHAMFLAKLTTKISLSATKLILQELNELPNKIDQVLDTKEEVERVSNIYSKFDNLMYIGRKYNYAIALEGALKIKEISYIHAEGLSGGELKHGFIALIDQNMPTIAICNQDSVYAKQVSNIQEIKARSGRVLAITSLDDNQLQELCDDQLEVPDTIEILQPLVNVVVMQLIAYYCAVARGLDVDKPRNLAKSVTVE